MEIRVPQTQIIPAGTELAQGAGTRYRIYFVSVMCEISMVLLWFFNGEMGVGLGI